MKGIKRGLVVALMLLFLQTIFAQTLCYSTTFETAQEREGWVFPTYTDMSDAFVIGQAIQYTGDYSLYISADGGTTCSGSGKAADRYWSCYKVLDLEAGEYNFSFDLLAFYGTLAVGFVPDDVELTTNIGSVIPQFDEQCYFNDNLYFDTNNKFVVAQKRSYYLPICGTYSVPQTGRYKLFFQYLITNPGLIFERDQNISIDNIQLYKKQECLGDCEYEITTPTVTKSGDTYSFSWTGDASNYEIEIDKVGGGYHTTATVATNSYSCGVSDEGTYLFRVRPKVGETPSLNISEKRVADTWDVSSSFTSATGTICVEEDGIYYLWFAYSNGDGVTQGAVIHGGSKFVRGGDCYSTHGKALYIVNQATDEIGTPATPANYTAIVYRTFHLEPGQYDLAFDYCAQTSMAVGCAPASVDLETQYNKSDFPPLYLKDYIIKNSNTDVNGLLTKGVWVEAPSYTLTYSEGRDFTITIETEGDYKIFFVWNIPANNSATNTKYALDNVQLAKKFHGSCATFTRPTTVSNGANLDIEWSGAEGTTYEIMAYPRYDNADGYKTVKYYKNITSPQFSLPYRDFPQGVVIFRIRAICGSDADCGEIPAQFVGPEGFDFLWYAKGDVTKTPLGNERVFVPAANSVEDFEVDIMHKDNHACFYTMSVNNLPRVPKPDTTYSCLISNCSYEVVLSDNSKIYKIDRNDEEHLESGFTVDKVYWSCAELGVTESQGESLHLVVPQEGGTYHIVQRVLYEKCEKSRTYELEFAPLIESSPTTIYVDGLKYAITGSDAILTGRNCDEKETEFVVPQSISCGSGNYQVTGIEGEDFGLCGNIKKVIFLSNTPQQLDNDAKAFLADKKLVVPCGSVTAYKAAWGTLTGKIEGNCAEVAEFVGEENSLTLVPTSSEIEITWERYESAVLYNLTVTEKKSGVVVVDVMFNANGEVVDYKRYAPGERQIPRAILTADGYQYTITGLDSDTEYDVLVTSTETGGQVVSVAQSTVTTLEYKLSGVENTYREDVRIENGRVICSGEFEIYTIMGINITNQNGTLPSGIYVVIPQNGNAVKVVVR